MKIGKNWHLKLRLKIEKLQKELDLKTIRLRIAEKKLIKYENRISRTG
tara:strand:+ start:782 stop:925 length:144 start_codon:yes stop_codon:yes gene_type:complete